MTGELGAQTFNRLRAAAAADDAHGNAEFDWAHQTSVPIAGCQIDPGPTREDLINRDTTLTTWNVYAPEGTDITELDRAEYLGDTFRIDGKPVVWPDPGNLGYVKVVLVEWRG
jgi:hypothetical protein